jgi:ankyrin repeat protein
MLAILNTQNKSGNTALHWAALNGHLESVKVLLQEGSDPTITNQKGHDAVFEAELYVKKEVVEWVLKEGGEGLEEGISGDTEEGSAGVDEDMEVDEVDNGAEGDLSKKLQEKFDGMDFEDAKPNS